jgi:hypothetical protein
VFCTTAMAMVENVQEAPVPVTPNEEAVAGEYMVASVKNRLPDGLGTCRWRAASLDSPTCVTTSPPRPRNQAAAPLRSPSTASAGLGGALRTLAQGDEANQHAEDPPAKLQKRRAHPDHMEYDAISATNSTGIEETVR